jgi:23S rRNA (guanosine2251-2'-O)-methyltransferase
VAQEIRWIGGAHSVTETLRSKPQSAKALWVEHESKSPSVSECVKLARQHGIPVQFMSRGEMDRATAGARHQGLALKVVGQSGKDLQGFLANLSAEEKASCVLVALDEIQDPHNLGAIARSALNFGAKALILPERRSAPVSAVAIQASAGAIQKLEVLKVVNLSQAIERCKEAGFWVYGADVEGQDLFSAKLNLPMVLVIGSEGYGMRAMVKEHCDELLRIPQAEASVQSLNASCAASVLLYEIFRQKSA